LQFSEDLGVDNVISLADYRRGHESRAEHQPRNRFARATFVFDLMLPQTYLAAERVDRMFSGLRWQPAFATELWDGEIPTTRLVEDAEDRAAALGVPLVWPEGWPAEVRPAMRVAALACDLGRGAAFVLAAGRLAYCGGFDLGAPDVLAEAAAAASLPLDLCLAAAGDPGRDALMSQAGRRLREAGATDLPALRVARRVFAGEMRIAEAFAASMAAEAAPSAPRPLTA
jgi:2-hydroxychromene-2-carboxylate isomerase